MRRGAANLARHIEIVRRFGITPVVAVNRFAGDSDGDVQLARALALEHGALAAEVSDAVERGGDGALALAEAVAYAASDPQPLDFIYELDDPIAVKIERIATRVYGASGVSITPEAERTIAACEVEGLGSLPVCMAKTPLSLSHDPALINSPHDFVLPVREVRPYTGAGWLVVLCGDLITMPGLPAEPAALQIDIDESGRTVGLW
jgi:formyltetrahydrofolate synthetase